MKRAHQEHFLKKGDSIPNDWRCYFTGIFLARFAPEVI
jgi:hypothetical protein